MERRMLFFFSCIVGRDTLGWTRVPAMAEDSPGVNGQPGAKPAFRAHGCSRATRSRVPLGRKILWKQTVNGLFRASVMVIIHHIF